MELLTAANDVLLGASMRQIAGELREQMIADLGVKPEEIEEGKFGEEVAEFMRRLARHLGEKHLGDPRAGQALHEWVMLSDHYEAWDALLSGFDIEGRDGLVRRGRMLFPGALTAHWDDIR